MFEFLSTSHGLIMVWSVIGVLGLLMLALALRQFVGFPAMAVLLVYAVIRFGFIGLVLYTLYFIFVKR